ncbi:MAG TPA: 4Fe-4S dicluster domain-containing protein [Candidatus Nitrosotalea sp.]|nr:4Fe-4S dicluster domain-containing protein [Candidatus Nitrosotalea sp.]
MRYGFVIDQRKCIGCHACTVACKEENQVPLGVNRTWVKYIEKGVFPDTRRYFSVMRCNHCDNAPCVTICPTVALYRRPDGIVDFDGERCIGCKSCMQACPYDALYIDPDTKTAAKCHYCAHRVEVGLEPACVVVCPVQAIVPGDLDDPHSPIARLVASQQTQVRKPEQGTRPKLFYLGAESAALTPDMHERRGGYVFSQVGSIPSPGQPNRPLAPAVAGSSAPATSVTDGMDLLALARTVYDVAHPERPWGWKVSTYLWTKSIAAGALLVASLGVAAGFLAADALTALVAPGIGLLFLLLTSLLLVLDLKRPERFLYVIFKPNPRSWLVLGGFILFAAGLLGTLWLLAGVVSNMAALHLLAWPVAVVAAATAGYSAFLFGQAEGRDFWQSPLLLPHLLVAALVAGSASLLLAARALGSASIVAGGLGLVLWGSLLVSALVLFAELFTSHATQDATRAARLLTHGRLRVPLWGGVIGAGIALPLVLLLSASVPFGSELAAALALGGLWLWEDLWVRAGQMIPLS